jgi:hypothetical protein
MGWGRAGRVSYLVVDGLQFQAIGTQGDSWLLPVFNLRWGPVGRVKCGHAMEICGSSCIGNYGIASGFEG